MNYGHNPYLPLNVHIPDGEPHIFQNRLYVFGSHDKENGNEFCELNYVAYSAPLDDLSDWRFEGTIFRKDQDPYNDAKLPLYAPDVCEGMDGKYYLYYCIKFQDYISVAVCDTPAGQYKYLARISYKNGTVLTKNQPYDPAVICDKGKVYLYYGFAPCMVKIPRYEDQDLKGCSVIELETDMVTVKEGPVIVIPSRLYGKDTSFEGNEYFEGPSIRKINEKYYLIYSSVNTHQLCYATSDDPMQGFTYGGVIISNGDVGYNNRKENEKLMSVGNNHGGLVKVKNQWYIFYHRHTSLNQYTRQGCAERVHINDDGSIPQVTITTSGVNQKPLPGKGNYPAVLCCNLSNGNMGALSSMGRTNQSVDFPFLSGNTLEYYIDNISDGTLIGYKYINLKETERIRVVYKADAEGYLEIGTSIGTYKKAKLKLYPNYEWTVADVKTSFENNDNELYFVYRGTGKVQLLEIQLG